MANEGRSIFNRKAEEKLRSPDDLDKYVRVTNPSVWVLIVGCLALLIGLLAWGFFGTVASSVTAPALRLESDAVYCFVSPEDKPKITVGDAVTIGNEKGTVYAVDNLPLSKAEVKEALTVPDYLMSTAVTSDWTCVVHIDLEEGENSDLMAYVPLTATITTERIAPISLVFGN